MKPNIDHIVFFRELSLEQAEALRETVATDPEAARAFHAWRAIREALGRRLDEQIPDRELFALFILHEYGHHDVLTGHEQARADEAAPEFRTVLSRHVGLQGVGHDIDAAARQFEASWDEWFGADVRAPRADRTPLREGRQATGRPRSHTARWSARIATGLAVIVFGALLVLVLERDHGMTTVETADGAVQTVTLGDGSEVRLLGGSRLSYTPPTDAAPLGRQIVLDGRAYFDIAPAGEGLVIKTETAQLTVVGTAFGVRAESRTTEVVLAEGRLTLASRGAPSRAVALNAGQMSRVDEDAPPSSPEAVAVHEQLAWTGLFVFTSAPLADILDELSRHYDEPLSTSEPLGAERITGRFERDQDLSQILSTLADAVGADVQQAPEGGYRLAP